MKRTARLVRRALEGQAAAPDPWIRGAADVAAAVARSGTGSRHEGTAAAVATGPGGAVIPSRDPSLTAGVLGGGPGRRVVHAAGGPGASSTRDIANAAGAISSRGLALAAGGSGAVSSRDRSHAAGGGPSGGISSRGLSHATAGGPGGLISASDANTGGPPGTMSPRGLARAAGGPGKISSRVTPHAAGGVVTPRDLNSPAGAVISTRDIVHGAGGVINSRDLAQAAGSGHELAAAGRYSGRERNMAVAKERGQGGREATEHLGLGLAKGDQAERVDTDTTESSSSTKVCSDTVIHDKTLLPARKEKNSDMLVDMSGGDEEWSTELDISEKITAHLTQSSAPIDSFQINYSKWINHACLEKWLDLLSVRSVKELDLLNLGHSENTIFPLESFRSKNLQFLRIGFFILPLDLNCFDYSCLNTLELFACTFDGNKLSWVISDCPSLQILKVYHCSVDLHVKSNSLQYLDCFGITGNRMVIASAPNLLRIAYGIMPPKQKSAIVGKKILASASIYLTDVPSLMVMDDLSLTYNKILVNTKDLAKEVVLLPSVIQLCLSLEMTNAAQLQNLCKLLQSLPQLETLNVERIDNLGSDEAFDTRIDEPFEDIGSLHCVKNRLTSVSVQEFRGGDSEKHFIKCLLKNAPHLIQISTRRCLSASKEIKKSVRNAVEEIKSYDRAAKGCRLYFE